MELNFCKLVTAVACKDFVPGLSQDCFFPELFDDAIDGRTWWDPGWVEEAKWGVWTKDRGESNAQGTMAGEWGKWTKMSQWLSKNCISVFLLLHLKESGSKVYESKQTDIPTTSIKKKRSNLNLTQSYFQKLGFTKYSF